MLRWSFLPKLQSFKNRWFCSIPSQIVRLKSWKKGEELAFIACENGDIKLKEVLPKR
jgi:hypothetical protein